MNTKWAARGTAVCVLLFAATSCGGDADGDDDVSGQHSGHELTDAAVANPTEEDVPCTPDYPTFRAGLSVQAGALSVALVMIQPAPPRQKVMNDWVVEIRGTDGTPLRGASLENAASYMEVHRHFGKAPPTVSELAAPGQYKLDNIDFKMRGPWEVLFDVRMPSGSPQPVKFKICVE